MFFNWNTQMQTPKVSDIRCHHSSQHVQFKSGIAEPPSAFWEKEIIEEAVKIKWWWEWGSNPFTSHGPRGHEPVSSPAYSEDWTKRQKNRAHGNCTVDPNHHSSQFSGRAPFSSSCPLLVTGEIFFPPPFLKAAHSISPSGHFLTLLIHT